MYHLKRRFELSAKNICLGQVIVKIQELNLEADRLLLRAAEENNKIDRQDHKTSNEVTVESTDSTPI